MIPHAEQNSLYWIKIQLLLQKLVKLEQIKNICLFFFFVVLPGSVDAQCSVDRSTVYQEMFGIGGAMTDAAGINIASLSQDAQDNLLR